MRDKIDIINKTDEQLVKLILKNQDYFLHLIDRYQAKLLRYVLRISNVSKEEAEDILQDSFIKVYKNLNDFDISLKFSSWIYRIVHNQVISNHRKLKARPQTITIDNEEDTTIMNKLISGLDLEEELGHKLMKEDLQRVLERMDKKYREVLVLNFLEEKSYKEISDILKKPINTVGTLINRAKKHFFDCAKKQGIKF